MQPTAVFLLFIDLCEPSVLFIDSGVNWISLMRPTGGLLCTYSGALITDGNYRNYRQVHTANPKSLCGLDAGMVL